ncbi:MAG: zinc ribbon domain-containing protein [Gammaproteobacteria bacterium]|jgi:putative FmdB family regulatory protein
MPIYEYECRECGHVFDALQKMSDAPLTDCPDCGQPKLRKLLSAPNFRLKGGGWYETDFKDKNKRNLAGADKPAASNDGGADTAAASKDSAKTDVVKTDTAKSSKEKSGD